MNDNIIKNAVEEIKGAGEEKLREVIEQWFTQIRTMGMKIGAQYIAAGAFGIIQKHTAKPSVSLRDYKRMTDELIKMFAIQINADETIQNDSEENTANE